MKAIIQTCAVIALLFLGGAHAKDTLSVGWHDWPPHQALGKRDPATGINDVTGINIDLVNEAFARAGLEAHYIEMPWKRNLVEIERGNVDVALSAGITPEREKYAYFSKGSLKLEYNALFIRKADKEKFANIKALKDIRGTELAVGIAPGTSYSDEFESLIKDPEFAKRLEQASADINNVKKLAARRIDAFLADELVGVSLLNSLGLDDQVEILFYLYGESDAKSYLMFSQKTVSKAQVAAIDKALESMKQDGTYQKILSKYQLKH